MEGTVAPAGRIVGCSSSQMEGTTEAVAAPLAPGVGEVLPGGNARFGGATGCSSPYTSSLAEGTAGRASMASSCAAEDTLDDEVESFVGALSCEAPEALGARERAWRRAPPVRAVPGVVADRVARVVRAATGFQRRDPRRRRAAAGSTMVETFPQAGASVQMFLSRCVTLLIPRQTIALVVLCHSGLRNILCRTPRIVPRLCRVCDLLRLLLVLPVPGWDCPTIRAGWSTGIQGMGEQRP